MCRAVDVWARRVDRRMDHERRLVQKRVRARLSRLDDGMVIHEDEVFGLDEREVLALVQPHPLNV